jgi:methyl-accepting chemotaxis protein
MKNIGDTLDLTLRVELDKKDELGETAISFNALLEKMRHVLSSVRDASKEVQTQQRKLPAVMMIFLPEQNHRHHHWNRLRKHE